VTHIPRNILLAGPPRKRWAYAMEAYNRRVSLWAHHSGYKNVVKHVANNISLEHAYDLRFN